MRLHPDVTRPELLVAFGEEGQMIARGYLDLEPSTGSVRFINQLTRAQVEGDEYIDSPVLA